MAFATVMLLLFGYVVWLLTSHTSEPTILRRGAYDEILATVSARYRRGDLSREEYDRILQVLR